MKKLVIILLLFLVTGCSQVETTEKSFFVMDTYISIKIYDKNKNDIVNEIEKMFNYYDKLFDRFNPSDINNVYTLNNKNEKIEVDPKLYELLLFSNKMNVESQGLLDINMGLVIDLWKKAAIDGVLPNPTSLNEAYSAKKEMELSGSFVTTNGGFIDVGAVAKGFALKEIVAFLEKEGVNKYIINAGGQVHVGTKYRTDKYKIGIKNPDGGDNLLIVNAEKIGISTSGGYERKFEVDGIMYNHIINPKTLYPANYMKSVSVISKDPLLADALTTILFLMPIEDGLEYIKNYDAEAIFYTNDSKVIKTEGFEKYE